MKRFLCAVALSASAACSIAERPQTRSVESALEVEPAGYAPLQFDLEGTWVLYPGQMTTETRYGGWACEEAWAKENKLALGRDTLRLTKGEITLEEGIIRVPYSGTLSHWEGFGSDVEGGVTYGCVAENIQYDVTAELLIQQDGGFTSFGGEARVTSNARYNHARIIGLAPALVGARGDGTRQMFEGGNPDVALMTLSFGDYAGDTSIPEGCDFELEDVYYSERETTAACRGTKTATWRFEKVSGAPDVNPREDVTGEIAELLPDGSPTNRPIEHAIVQVFSQPRVVREQESGESDEAYAAYLERIEQSLVKAAADVVITPDAMGEFTVEDLPVLARDLERSTVYEAANYTARITRARSAETTPDAANENVLFERKTIYNVRAGDHLDVGLRPFDALGQKIAIAELLQAKAPKGWRPIETSVLDYLYDLEDGTAPMTPQANEAVRRALWSEYAARDGFGHADKLLGFMLDGFANLVGDFLIPDFDFNLRNIAKARKRIQNFSKEAARERSTLDVLRSAKLEDFHQKMKAAPNAGMTEAMKGRTAVAKRIKAYAKALVFTPTKQLANNYATGPNAALVGDIVDAVQLAFEGIVDVMITGNVGGVVKSVIKKRVQDKIKAARAPLLDSDGVIPVSFTQLASDGLQTTLNNISTWSDDDGTAYRSHRAASIEELIAMNQRASDLIAAQELVKATGSAASTVEDITGSVSVIPIAAYAEKLAKVVKTLSNVAMFVHPLVFVFFELPDAVNAAGNLAWGALSSGTNPQVFTGPLVESNYALTRKLDVSVAAFKERLQEIRRALASDDIERAIELVYGTEASPGMSVLYEEMVNDRDRLIDEAGGLATTDPLVRQNLLEMLALSMNAERLTAPLVTELTTFLIEAATGAHPSTLDAWYIMRRNRLVRTIDTYSESLNDVGWAGSLVGITDGEILAQLVRAEEVRVRDESGSESLDPSTAHTLTVTATVRNLSPLAIDGPFDVRLRATAASGTVSVTQPVQTIAATLGPFTDPDTVNGTEVTWTVNYSPGEVDDVVLVRIDFEENGVSPTRYNGAGAVAVFEAELPDADVDGLPDPWETRHGLPVDADSWDEDPDGDGVLTGTEFRLGLDPSMADTDGDGRPDGDEVYGGELGIASAPSVADTDEDGTLDGADGAPLDETSTRQATARDEPCVAVDVDSVVFTREEPAVIVNVTNACDGELRWTAHSEDLLVARPVMASRNGSGTQLVLMSGTPFALADFSDAAPPPTTTVWVQDTSGLAPDAVSILVSLGRAPDDPGEEMDEPGTSGPDAGELPDFHDSGFDADAGASQPSVGDDKTGGSGGCSCMAAPSPDASPLLALLLALLHTRRRKADM